MTHPTKNNNPPPNSGATQQNIQVWQAPIPPPSILAEYAKVDPSFPERILTMTEKQGDHRREMESLKLTAEIESIQKRFIEARIGQCCAFLIAISAIIASIIISIYGHPITGGSLGLAGLGAIVYAFVIGRRSQRGFPPSRE